MNKLHFTGIEERERERERDRQTDRNRERHRERQRLQDIHTSAIPLETGIVTINDTNNSHSALPRGENVMSSRRGAL